MCSFSYLEVTKSPGIHTWKSSPCLSLLKLNTYRINSLIQIYVPNSSAWPWWFLIFLHLLSILPSNTVAACQWLQTCLVVKVWYRREAHPLHGRMQLSHSTLPWVGIGNNQSRLEKHAWQKLIWPRSSDFWLQDSPQLLRYKDCHLQSYCDNKFISILIQFNGKSSVKSAEE